MLEPFIEYIAGNLNRSLEIMIKGAKGESIEEPDDIEKEIALLEQKLKGVGQPIEVSKSQESILEIYDNSLARLAEKFIEKGELFEKFYVKNEFYVLIDNSRYGYVGTKNEIVNEKGDRIDDGTDSVRLRFNYKAFSQIGFQEFYHASEMKFQFNYTRYKVQNTNGITFEKLYGEQLSEDEINKLVNSEIKKHTKLIEEKIKEINKKK